MKRHLKMSKVLSLLLTLALVLGLVPAMTPAAKAAGDMVKVGTMSELKSALQRSGDVDITVAKEIVHTEEITDFKDGYYITVGRGKKTLDLAGYKVELNVTRSGACTFIRVPTGADLTVTDSSAKGTGKLWCDGDMVFKKAYSRDGYFTNDHVRYRHTIAVDGGSFTLKGGEIEAGRAKEVYIYWGAKLNTLDWEIQDTLRNSRWSWNEFFNDVRYDGNAYQIVNGSGVTLNSGEVTINGGRVLGKGYRYIESMLDTGSLGIKTPYERAAAVRAVGGKLTLNGGVIYGMANADALQLEDSAKLELNGGYFETQLLKKIMVPSSTDSTRYLMDYPVVSIYDRMRSEDYILCVWDGAWAGKLGVPMDTLTDEYIVVYDGKPVYKENNWKPTGIVNAGDDDSAYVAHSLSVSKSRVGASSPTITLRKGTSVPTDGRGDSFSTSSSALRESQSVSSVALNVTMAKGMSLAGDTVKCSSTGVGSVNTTWYRNSSLITGPHTVNFGGYLAKVDVTAAKGHRFTSTTKFTIGGETPSLVERAADGSSAVVWSPAYEFKCDHRYNEDTSIKYNNAKHYQVCTVCGEHIGEKAHAMDGGVDSGGTTTYSCTTCDYSYERENGKVKIPYVVLDLPVAMGGDTIPTPALKPEYDNVAKVVSWEIKDSDGNAINPGDTYTAGKIYTFTVRAQANNGCYFDKNAKMNCAATSLITYNQTDETIIAATYKVSAYRSVPATVTLPEMLDGMTMKEYFTAVSATINGDEPKPTNNIQATIKTHGMKDEVYVKYSFVSGWSLVRGAKDLNTFFATTLKSDTLYDVSFDFSSDGKYISADQITLDSAANYEGITTEGGQVWFTVSVAVKTSPSNVSEIAVVSVTSPETGRTPEQDFDVLSHTTMDIVSGGWNTNTPFEPETEYTYTATVKLRKGYHFDPTVVGTVNGKPAQVSVSGTTATVTCTFPATEPALVEVPVGGVVITANPKAVDAKPGDTVTFTVAATGEDLHYQWWGVDAGVPEKFGMDIATLTFEKVPTDWDGMSFWCVVTGKNGEATSEKAKLSVSEKPYVFPFTDVPASAWYYESVKGANKMGLINGTSATTYSPNNNMTYAEAIKLAACMHQLYTDGKVTLTGGSPWYQPFYDYCREKGIIPEKMSAFEPGYNELLELASTKVTRAQYALIFSRALPDEALPEKNTIPNNSIPDVNMAQSVYDQAIYKLYRTGIVAGVDNKGTFKPDANITRSEVAAILIRMMDPSARVGAPNQLGK